MMQIRSDWVGEETGFEIGYTTKAKLKNKEYFELITIKAFKGVNVDDNKKEVNLSFTNNTGVQIKKMNVVGHYESTRGKPVPYGETKSFTNIKQKQTIKIKFQKLIKKIANIDFIMLNLHIMIRNWL